MAKVIITRFAVTTITVWPMLGLYLLIGLGQSTHTTLVMPAWVPFWPIFTFPYLSLLLVTWLLPLAIRQPVLFRGCLWAMICSYLLVMPWWILSPTTLLRPPIPSGPWSAHYLWLAAIDPPNNVMPCAHGMGPIVAVWFTLRDRPTWKWPLVCMLLIGLPSIALVWQHRPIDILLGTVAAMIGIFAGEARIRRTALW